MMLYLEVRKNAPTLPFVLMCEEPRDCGIDPHLRYLVKSFRLSALSQLLTEMMRANCDWEMPRAGGRISRFTPPPRF